MTNIGKIITSPFTSIATTYKNMSPWGKLLLFIVTILIVVSYFKDKYERNRGQEGFEGNDEKFVFKTGSDIYDDFYVDIYDLLVLNVVKNNYEIGQIVEKTKITEESRVLDIGSGSGHHTGALTAKGYNVIGLDNSTAMVKKAKANYPESTFEDGDALNAMAFQPSSFTHILCMYFTLYYVKDKMAFFQNCFNWLQPTGTLIVHVVDRDDFDPILPPGNALLMLTPQRYAKERITHTNVTFNNFKYSANFELDKANNTAKFVEKFKNKDSSETFRKQEHAMYMEPESDIIAMAKQCGFIVQGKIDLIKATYEYQYLYILVKPN